MAHELNIGTINGLSVNEILDLMVEKGIGIANPGTVIQKLPIVGNTFKMGDYTYRIVHVDDTTNVVYAALENWVEDCIWSDYRGPNNQLYYYEYSTIYEKCQEWYNTKIPQSMKDAGIFNRVGVVSFSDQTVYHQVFVPNGGIAGGSIRIDDLSYYSSYGNRIFYDEGGAAHAWWTASVNYQSQCYVMVVNKYGSISGMVDGTYNTAGLSFGFRPHVGISKSAFLNNTVS